MDATDPVLLTLAEALAAAPPRPTLVWGERMAPLRALLDDDLRCRVRFFTDDLATGRALDCPVGVAPERPASGGEAPTRVAVIMPRAKALLEVRVSVARALLAPGGELWVAGHQRDGVRSAEGPLGEVAAVRVEHLKRRCRVFSVAIPSDAPAVEMPAIDAHAARFEAPTVAGPLAVVTLPGVFGHGRLDAGTARLLAVLEAREPGYRAALDLGAGSGVLGAWLARRRPRASVTLCDPSALACEAARMTLAANGLEADVRLGAAEDMARCGFDLVVSNPPRHEGRVHAHELTAKVIEDAGWRLGKGGRFMCVASHSATVTNALEAHFRTVEVAHHDANYRVWDATR